MEGTIIYVVYIYSMYIYIIYLLYYINKMAGSSIVGIACRDLKTQSLNTGRVEDGEVIMGLPTRGYAGF